MGVLYVRGCRKYTYYSHNVLSHLVRELLVTYLIEADRRYRNAFLSCMCSGTMHPFLGLLWGLGVLNDSAGCRSV